jgi:hypothetical protein
MLVNEFVIAVVFQKVDAVLHQKSIWSRLMEIGCGAFHSDFLSIEFYL